MKIRTHQVFPFYSILLMGVSTGFSLLSHSGYGAGYEPAVLWSAHFAPMGNAAVSSVIGPQSLFFNPAGLAYVEGLEFSANLAAGATKSESSLVADNQKVAGTNQFGAPFSLLLDYEATPELGIGFGVYTSGQTRRTYENVDLSIKNTEFNALKPIVQSHLDFTEVALGAGYQLGSGFSVGASWRALIVTGAISMVTFDNPVTFARAIDIQDLSGVKASGLRFGLGYVAEDRHWGFGLTARTPVSFTAKGKASTRSEATTAGSPAVDQGTVDSEMASTFPAQISLGVHVNATSTFRILGQYDYSNYKKCNFISFTGTAASQSIPSLLQDWKDTHTARLGLDLQTSSEWNLRAGYVIESEYVPYERSAGILGEPGPTHTVGLGAGTRVGSWSLDFGGNYTFASGTVSSADALLGQAATAQTYIGTPSSSSYSIQLGASHRF